MNKITRTMDKIILTKEEVLERGRRYAIHSLGYRKDDEISIDEVARAYHAGFNLCAQAEQHLTHISITPRTCSVRVVCEETGEVFSSVTECAHKIGRSISNVSTYIRLGDKIDGKTYRKLDEGKYERKTPHSSKNDNL